MRRGWLRRNRLQTLCRPTGRQRVLLLGFDFAYFFGEVSERRPWAKRRETPGCFCPAFLAEVFGAGYEVALEVSMAFQVGGVGWSKKPFIQELFSPGFRTAREGSTGLGTRAFDGGAGSQARTFTYFS
jgi:hypothetical protein